MLMFAGCDSQRWRLIHLANVNVLETDLADWSLGPDSSVAPQ